LRTANFVESGAKVREIDDCARCFLSALFSYDDSTPLAMVAMICDVHSAILYLAEQRRWRKSVPCSLRVLAAFIDRWWTIT
jgi:hypothetical protein